MSNGTRAEELVAVHLAPQPRITLLGVEYLHLQLRDGSDLYVTNYGLPFTAQLLPENYWTDKAWFAEHSIKLPGSGTVYRIATKPVEGMSKDIVLKWNRMGQDIPGETVSADMGTARFNSPFEEFCLVGELRNSLHESPGRIYTHKPLAIYVPRQYVEAERLGRKRYALDAIQQKYPEVTLDRNRQYAVIYEWVKGIDAAEACREGIIDAHAMRELIRRANREMQDKGFVVWDNKPHHVIVRPSPDGQLVCDRDGRALYALVDFELLERTPQREQARRASRRKRYLVGQAHRFEGHRQLPPGLTRATIMGVDYVCGQVESTGGWLWVVGKDPMLFEYFLPEKWRRTPRTQVSDSDRAYHTVTKDNIHLVWRLSNVGKPPVADARSETERRVLAHGYNSPFEEFSLSMELTRKGIQTIYPRAIYMTGHKTEEPADVSDDSRYDSHASLRTPDGHPILGPNHDYMVIWGYWNGPDEELAVQDQEVYAGMNALDALENGRISRDLYDRVLQMTRTRLAAAGIEDLGLAGNHLMLSLDKSGHLATDEEDLPLVRICGFDLLRRITPQIPQR